MKIAGYVGPRGEKLEIQTIEELEKGCKKPNLKRVSDVNMGYLKCGEMKNGKLYLCPECKLKLQIRKEDLELIIEWWAKTMNISSTSTRLKELTQKLQGEKSGETK